MNKGKVTGVVVQPANLTSPSPKDVNQSTSPYIPGASTGPNLGDPVPLEELAPQAVETAIENATKPGALLNAISTIRHMLESSETSVDNGNKIFGMFGERFNEEGFHSEHPQIAAICEYIPIFKLCLASSNLSISKTDLNKIISRKDLKATAIHDLIEMQKIIRNSVVESTTELFKIFYKSYHLQDMSEESLQELSSSYHELFEFKNFIDITQEINQKTEVFKDIQYDFSTNNIDNLAIIEKLKSDLSTKYIYYADFVEKYIDTNPYISSVIGYYVLSRFAKGVVSVLKLLLENRETFLESFYIDVITNDDLLENSLNSTSDNSLINAYRSLDDNAVQKANNTMKHFFSEEIPTSLGLIRFIKGIHAFGSGFIDDAISNDTPYADNEENPGTLNGKSTPTSVKYLSRSRKCRMQSFVFDAHYRAFSMTNGHIDGYESLFSDNFDYGLIQYNEKSTMKALLPMIYDIKNSITFPNIKDAQADLIGKQLFGSNNSLTTKLETIRSDPYMVPPNPVDTTKDIVHMWDNDLKIDMSKAGMSDLDVGNILYQNLQDGRNLLIVDNKGFTNGGVAAEDNIAMRDYAFAIANSLRSGGNNSEVANICEKIKESANTILSDITDNYGIAGLSEFSDLPEEYVREFFEFIADELIKPMVDAPNNAGSDHNSVTHFVSALNLLIASSDTQFQKDFFKQGCWWYNGNSIGSKDYIRMSEPRYIIPGTGPGGTCAGVHEGYRKVRDSGYYGEGDPSGLQQMDESDVRRDKNAYYSHDPNEKFEEIEVTGGIFMYGDFMKPESGQSKYSFVRSPTDIIFNYLYYNIIPGTKNTVGVGDGFESGNTGLTKLGQWESSSDTSIFSEGSYRKFDSAPRHFMDESKFDSTRTVGNSSVIASSKLDQSITICTAQNLGAIGDAIMPDDKSAHIIGKLLQFDSEFLRKYKEDLGTAAGIDEGDTAYQTGNLTCNDSTFVTMNNALGTSSVSRSYLLYFLLVRLLDNTINLRMMTRGRTGARDNDSNNGARKIEIHYNNDNLQGLYDVLKEYSKPESASSDYDSGYDNGLDFSNSLIERCKHSEAGLLTSAVALIRIRNFFSNLKNRTESSFDHTNVINLQDFIENFDEELDYLNSFSYDQRNLSTFLNLSLLNPSIANFHLPSLKDITNNQIDCMKKFFAQDKYIDKSISSRSDINKKYIMHLGITNSLIETLRDKLFIEAGITDFTSDTSIQSKNEIRNRSIIKINLYRKNLINDKSIQVRSYLFDINKFIIENIKHQNINDLKVSTGLPAGSSIGTFLELHKLFDFRYSDKEFTGKLLVNSKSVSSDERNNISESEIDQLYTNHLEDFYLKMYCKSITGLDFDDDVFVNNNIARQVLDMNSQSLNVIQNYNSAFKSHLDNLLNISGNDQSYINEKYRIEKEAKRSLYFSVEKYMKRVLYPKTFDRVFSILVDLSDQPDNLESQLTSENTLTLDRFYYTVTLTDKLALFDSDHSQGQSSSSGNATVGSIVTSTPQVIQNLQLVTPSSTSPLTPTTYPGS